MSERILEPDGTLSKQTEHGYGDFCEAKEFEVQLVIVKKDDNR